MAKFQRKLEKLSHCLQAYRSKLRELDEHYHEDASSSSSSSSPRASRRRSVTSIPGGLQDISSCSSQDTGSVDYRLRQILAPLADLRVEDAFSSNQSPSFSSGSSIEDLPGERIPVDTDGNVPP